jgi:hypothetical protein
MEARLESHSWDGVRSRDLCLPLHSFCTVIPAYSSTNVTSSHSFLPSIKYQISSYATFPSPCIQYILEAMLNKSSFLTNRSRLKIWRRYVNCLCHVTMLLLRMSPQIPFQYSKYNCQEMTSRGLKFFCKFPITEAVKYNNFARTVAFYNLRDIWYMIYLLTAIGLSPGGSTHLHTNNT